MKFKKFCIKHQDKIELARAYFGVILFLFIMMYFNFIPISLDGILNTQVETIIDTCINHPCLYAPPI